MTTLRFLFCLFLCGWVTALSATTDKYRAIFTTDPATSITIAWNQVSGNSPVVRYDVVDHGTNASAYANAKSVDRVQAYRGMNNHFARLTGLQPNTAYYFVIEDSEGTSSRYWFRTTPADNSRLSFIAGGDSRNNRSVRRNANLLVSKLKPHAVLFGGDMINSDVDLEWQEWMDDWQSTVAPDGRMTPIVPARGNHEAASSIYQLFDTPTTDAYYALTFGNDLLRAYTLNSEISVLGDQLTWLTNDLNANDNVRWKSAQYHKPMRPHTSGKTEGNSEYGAWAQLFYDQEVRLVIDCDSHMAKTTWPVAPSSATGSDEGFIRNDARGTVYAGEGCWGAPLRPADDNKAWTRASGSFNQFKLIFVDYDKIELRTIKVDNAASVAAVSNNDPFTLPAGLDVWSPSSGAVVTILPIEDCPTEGQACDDGDPNTTNDVVDAACVCAGTPLSGTLDIAVATGNDDVEQNEVTGAIYSTSTDIELVYDTYNSAGNQTVGLRFAQVALPQGAVIVSAYLQFRTDEANSVTTNLSIRAEDADNAAPFGTTAYDVSNRIRVPGSVAWSPAPWATIGEAGTDQRSPDLAAILQPVIDRAGWQMGNALSLSITGTGERTADSFEGGAAPRLIIEYDTPDPCPGGPVTYYADTDGDGFGDPAVSVSECSQPAGHVTDNTDCDDTRSTVYPGAPELCDDLDNDCDNVVDNTGTTATYYADTDGDGFGDPASPVTDCEQPAGYVADNTDCNDGDATAYPGAPCTTDPCLDGETLDANCNCSGGTPAPDSDNDGVCDAEDICPGGDDSVDTDGNGTPDFCDCSVVSANFNSPTLSHSGSGSSESTLSFSSGSTDPTFTVSGLNARLDGKPKNRYEEQVTVTYVDGSGTTLTYGTFSGGTVSNFTAIIAGEVVAITVSLSDGYDGNASGNLAVDLGSVSYCSSTPPCPDADNDGTCDADDNCPGFDDRLIGQACDDGDNCTENDVWGFDCGCAGTPIAGCESCDNPVTSTFSPNPLTHNGGGSSSATVSLGGNHTNASFTISGLGARTGGKPANRFQEDVTVTYVDGNGNTVTYGSFSGTTQSSVDVTIAGPVQTISVSLSNGQNTNANLNIDLSAVSSCDGAAAFAGKSLRSTPVVLSLYPNPTQGMTTLQLGAYTGATTVIVRDIRGAVIRQYQTDGQPTLRLDTDSWAGGQVYLVSLYAADKQPVTKRLVVR